MRNKVIFIGPCGGGGIPNNGASVKNFQILNSFRMRKIEYTCVDTEFWRKSPWILIKLLLIVLLHPYATYIVSASNASAYRSLYLLGLLTKGTLIYWVIGGSLANWIEEGKVKVASYQRCTHILVEGESMRKKMQKYGLANVITLPNFKVIDFVPLRKPKANDTFHFVFLSRITPLKGCNEIFEAAKALNAAGYQENYDITFFGPVDNEYAETFYREVGTIDNVWYKGFLNLGDCKNYEVLSQYDVMLFPTFWHGEGFPGILIDAYVAGLPIIATDWNLNKDLVEEDITGIIIPPHDVDALKHAMLHLVSDKNRLVMMQVNSQQKAMDYEVNRVLSDELYKKLGII